MTVLTTLQQREGWHREDRGGPRLEMEKGDSFPKNEEKKVGMRADA